MQQNIEILSDSNFTLPVSSDALSVIHTKAGLPPFVEFKFPLYIFHPMKPSDLGIFTINGELHNNFEKIDFSFKINVTNQPPKLLKGSLRDFKIPIKTIEIFNVSEGFDRENQKITYEANE